VAVSPLGLPSRDAVVADAIAVGRSLGLVVDDAEVLKDSLNLLVWLRPSPVVARIQVRTGLVRTPDAAADSLALARYLTDAGLPVSPPADDIDPGPHVGATGHSMTLWRRLDLRDDPPDPAAAGRSLRELHEAMAGFDGPLRHVGPIEEIRRLVELLVPHRPDEARRIEELTSRIVLPDLPAQAIHGDAHLNNVVTASDGIRWVDWEESWRGPVAWDLACLDHQRRTFGDRSAEIGRAIRAYGPYDRDAVDAWLPALALWAAAWGLLAEVDGLDWGPLARSRLDWVERRLEG
jgi:Ser/Thr protein kinase RdoA (MazF antagonist)